MHSEIDTPKKPDKIDNDCHYKVDVGNKLVTLCRFAEDNCF